VRASPAPRRDEAPPSRVRARCCPAQRSSWPSRTTPPAGGKVDVEVVPKPEASKAVIRAALQGAAAFLLVALARGERDGRHGHDGAAAGKGGERGAVISDSRPPPSLLPGAHPLRGRGHHQAGRPRRRVVHRRVGRLRHHRQRGQGRPRGPRRHVRRARAALQLPRAASVVATAPSRVWALDRVTFRMIASTARGSSRRSGAGCAASSCSSRSRTSSSTAVAGGRRGARVRGAGGGGG